MYLSISSNNIKLGNFSDHTSLIKTLVYINMQNIRPRGWEKGRKSNLIYPKLNKALKNWTRNEGVLFKQQFLTKFATKKLHQSLELYVEYYD